MEKDTLILLIDESSTAIDSIRGALGDHASHLKLRLVADVPTALARIWGGGVDMVLINFPAAGIPEGDRLGPFRELQSQAQGIPIVVLCGAADKSLGESAVREGAADYLIRDSNDVDTLRVLRSVAGKTRLSQSSSRPAAAVRKGKAGKVLAFMGSKGGVGTSTVALNVAAALAQERKVILVELHSELGTLPHYFQIHRSIPDVGDLFREEDILPGELETCLWPCKNVPGLQVLFGSRNPEKSRQLSPENVKALLALMTEFADYVVIDLPVSLSDTNRTVFEGSDFLTLVLERDSISVQSAKRILHSVDSWSVARISIGAVIVNRSALVSPMQISEIETQLSIPILVMIPPSPDLCAAAQNAHVPLVTLDGDSLPAMALRELSRVFSEQVPLSRPTEPAGAAKILARAGVR